MTTLFDYTALAERLRIPQDRLRELETLVRQQYAGDEMMVELRLLRTLRAIEEGAVRLEEAIAEFRADPARTVAHLA